MGKYISGRTRKLLWQCPGMATPLASLLLDSLPVKAYSAIHYRGDGMSGSYTVDRLSLSARSLDYRHNALHVAVPSAHADQLPLQSNVKSKIGEVKARPITESRNRAEPLARPGCQ